VTAGSSEASSKARCAGWRPFRYSGANDTLDTIQQARVHNQTGINKRCWSGARTKWFKRLRARAKGG
jgi:hypothetical protein